MWSSRWKVLFALILFLLLGLPISSQPAGFDNETDSVPLDDDSDWWSVTFPLPWAPMSADPVEKEVAPGTSQIAGVSLHDEFDDIAAKLGKTPMMDRPFRNQICYSSADGAQKVYLVFEVSEIDQSFYLFTGGPKWSGSNLCRGIRQVSTDLTTDSGLRLGLSEGQVKGILGEPDSATRDTFIYSRKVRSPEDPEAVVFIQIRVHFTDSKLTYLGVSESWD